MNGAPPRLARVVGVPGAVLLGLGSMLGTGIFVSLGTAAGVAGSGVLPALALAAAVATCNGLSSAELAANHPESGGTYEYGHRWLSPALGFVAGFTFLCAKTASAATAAIGFAGYALSLFGEGDAPLARNVLAAAAALALTALAAGGLRRSSRANTMIVALTLLGLGAFVVFGLPAALRTADLDLGGARLPDLLHAAALMFVAYTGYARIATLGEEVREPRRSIPRAIVITLLVTMLLYAAVAFVALAAAGAPALATATASRAAPLAVVAADFGGEALALAVSVAAVTAMLGVLLNLLLGLSRVVLAMARRGDLPRGLAVLGGEASEPMPRRAVVAVGVVIAVLAAFGSVRATWSFSAFTVLVYYAITNLAALRLERHERLYPRWVAALGLVGCAALAFFVEPLVWGTGLALIAVGLVWHLLRRRASA